MPSRTAGRYDRVNEAFHPGRGLLPPGSYANGNVEIRHARVEDPDDTRAFHLQNGKSRRVAINLRNSPLEREYAYKRLSESAYRAGLIFEAMLEANLFGMKAPALDRIPGVRGANDAAINRMLDRAQSAVAFQEIAKRACGATGHAVLCATLARGRSFEQIALAQGMGRVRGGRKIAREFRAALEALGRELGR